MTDIAALGFRINSDGTVTATNRLDRMTDASQRAEKGAHGLEGTSNRMSGSLARLAKVAAGLGATLAAAFTVRNMAQMVDTWSDLSSRIGLAVGNMERAPEVMSRIGDMARSSYSSLADTAEAFAQNSTALRELGLNTRQQLDYTEALNNAMVVSGAKGQQAASVQRALSNAMGLGRLQGDQLNTILMQGGRVAELLAEELDTTVGGLRKLSAEGKITGDVLARAMIGNLQTLRDEAEMMPATIGDGITQLGNAFLQTVGMIDKATGATEALGAALVRMADRFRNNSDLVATAIKGMASAMGDFARSIRDEAVKEIDLLRSAFGLTETAGTDAFASISFGIDAMVSDITMLLGWIDSLVNALNSVAWAGTAANAALRNLFNNPLAAARQSFMESQAAGRSDIAGSFNARAARLLTDRRQQEALARINEALGFRFAEADAVAPPAIAQTVADAAKKAKEAEDNAVAEWLASIRANNEALELAADFRRRMASNLGQASLAGLRQTSIGGGLQSQFATVFDFMQSEIARMNEAMNEPFRRMAEFGKQISDNLAQAIVYGQNLGQALVTSLKAAAAEAMASGLFKLLLGDKSGGGGLFGSIFKGIGSLFGGARANGGPVSPNRAYLVGERGPELLVPRAAGHVIANDNLRGGGTVINVDARGATDPGIVREAARRGALEGHAAAMDAMRRGQRPALARGLG